MALVHSEPGGFVALHLLPNGNSILSSVGLHEIAPVVECGHIAQLSQVPLDHNGKAYALYVEAGHRNSGMGTRLVSEAMRITERAGGTRLTVISADKSEGFYRTLAQRGFVMHEESDEKGRAVFTFFI